MSASREKKQRQTVVSQGPTQAQIREQKEAAAKKRQTIIYWIIGIVATAAVIALLVWNSGIFQRRAIAATVGDTKLTVGEMQCYYGLARDAELNNQYYYSVLGYTLLSDPYKSYDFSSSLGAQQIYNSETNQTYQQHWEESALSYARQVISISETAKANNYTLSADGQKAVEDSMASLSSTATSANYLNADSYLSANYGRYVTQDIYKSIITSRQLASEYQDHCEEGRSFDLADYHAYAEENPANVYSYDFRYAFVSGAASTTDADGNTIEPTDEQKAAALEAAKVKADSIVAGVQQTTAEDLTPDDGDKTPDDGDKTSDDGDKAPDDGDKTSDNGDKTPDDGDKAPDDGDKQDGGEGTDKDATLALKEDIFSRLVSAALGATSSFANPSSNLQTAVLGYDLHYYGTSYYEWLTSTDRAAGDIAAIESGSSSNPGYYVILFLDRYLNDENTVNVRHILIQPEELKDDPDTPDVDESKGREDDPETKDIDEATIPTDEQLAAAKAKAEDILAQFLAGEQTESAFGTLANENSSDGGSNTAGGLYTYVAKGDMVEEFDAWIFDPARQPGDTGIVEHVAPGSRYYGYHVMYFVGVNDPRWRSVADNALKSDASNAWLDDIQAPYAATWVDKDALYR